MEDSYYDDNGEESTLVYEHSTSYIIIYTLTIVISLPGNLCIVLSVWRNKAQNDAVWYMLAAISLSLAIQNITTTIYIVDTIKVEWIFGPVLCKFLPFVDLTTITFTSLSFPAMCIMRLLSHSVMKRSFRKHPKYNSAIAVGIIAVISIAVCIPMAIFRNVEDFHRIKFCKLIYPTPLSRVMWITLHFILSFAVPFIILWSVNSRMYFNRRNFFSVMSTETFSSNAKSKNQVTCLLFMFALSFTLLCGPSEILLILHTFDVVESRKAARVTYLLYTFFPASIPLISFASFYSTSSGILFHRSSSRSLSHTTSSVIQYVTSV